MGNLVQSSSCLPYQDIKPLVKSSLFRCWQLEWDRECENKLHVTKPVLGAWESSSCKSRLYETLLCRLRIGHSFITHKYLLWGEDPPICDQCGDTLTILHILWSCPALEPKHRVYFPELFRQQIPFHPALLLGENPIVPFSRVIDFLTSIGILYQI